MSSLSRMSRREPPTCRPERSEGPEGSTEGPVEALGPSLRSGRQSCVIEVRDWRTTEAALQAARESGTTPTLVTPEDAASFYGAGYLAALQERARQEFPDVAFTLIVDCGDAPGHALACLRAGVKRISMDPMNDKIADIARQMGAELVRRPT